MCPLYRVSALERFCYKGFLRNSSGTNFFVRLREVSALEDVRFRDVPLVKDNIDYLCDLLFDFEEELTSLKFQKLD